MKELLKEIEDTKQSIKELEDYMLQQKLKGIKFSTAMFQEYTRDKMRLETYLKGLLVAKTFIEKEGK